MKRTRGIDATLIKGSGGQFEVVLDGKPIFSKKLTGRFPEPGEILGVSWIASPYVSEFDATAVESGSAIEVDAACLRGKCIDDPELGHELYRRFATMLKSRLHATRLQLLDLYGPGDAR